MIEVVRGLRRSLGLAFLACHGLLGRSRGKAFSLLSAGAFASFGARSVLQTPIRLQGFGRIAIGDDVFVGSGSWLHVLADDSGEVALSIGSGTSFAGNCVLSAASSIHVGEKVLFARNVYVSDHIHAYDDPDRAVIEQGVTRIESVVIGDGAWLGQNVVVCPGVRIGTGAVIGANSVVRDDVPDYSLAVGAPARVVRRTTEALQAVR